MRTNPSSENFETEPLDDMPAWVKLSTGFKKVMAGLDEYSLKVFLYIGLSINFYTGEAFPGLRKIAKDTGMAVNTVQKAVDKLEKLGFLTVERQIGAGNIYRPIRYISIGAESPDGSPQILRVSPQDDTAPGAGVSRMHDTSQNMSVSIHDDTVLQGLYHEKDGLYHENDEPYHENSTAYHAQEGILHNKNNKKNKIFKQDDDDDIEITQIEFQINLPALERLSRQGLPPPPPPKQTFPAHDEISPVDVQAEPVKSDVNTMLKTKPQQEPINGTQPQKEEDMAETDFRKIRSDLLRLCMHLPEDAEHLINTWLEKHPPVRIHEAIDVARSKRIRSSDYVETVLRGWEENGYPPPRVQ